jgi:A/G-specific adenine glycosylase
MSMATACRTDCAARADRREQAGRWLAGDGSGAPARLLAWFDRCGRRLPWRLNKDPYRIWLAEIMLQQTQVQTVIPYYKKFLLHWPAVGNLALASEEAVLRLWSGLGYYARARHLLEAARQVQRDHAGRIPADFAALRALPGIGDYTAAAILSIAFGQPVAAVDGNIVRVFARLAAIAWNPADPAQRREVAALSRVVLPVDRPGDWNEALMDLGATICLPRQPLCPSCPLSEFCRAAASGQTDRFPKHPPGRAVPSESRILLALLQQGRVHVRQRPARGLLAGLYEFDWLDENAAAAVPTEQRLPVGQPPEKSIGRLFPDAAIRPLGRLAHRFSHLQWLLEGFAVILPETAASRVHGNDPLLAGRAVPAGSGEWIGPARLADLPFATALAGYRDQIRDLLAGYGCAGQNGGYEADPDVC